VLAETMTKYLHRLVSLLERLCYRTEHRCRPLCRWITAQKWWWESDYDCTVSRLHQWTADGVIGGGGIVHGDGSVTEL